MVSGFATTTALSFPATVLTRISNFITQQIAKVADSEVTCNLGQIW